VLTCVRQAASLPAQPGFVGVADSGFTGPQRHCGQGGALKATPTKPGAEGDAGADPLGRAGAARSSSSCAIAVWLAGLAKPA